MEKNIVLFFLLGLIKCNGAPTRMKLPAYVIKFVALFPGGNGPLAYCDYNSTPRSRNACDYRVHFDVLFQDDPYLVPYADLHFNLPNNEDYFVAEPTARYWLPPVPMPSYPGEWQSLTRREYMHILRDDANGIPINFRITVFDRDLVGQDDVIAQESFSYTLNDVLNYKEVIQTRHVKCKPMVRCKTVMIKFMFYLLEDEGRG